MRRGHPGIGGWRSENPRHFRPRNCGPPRFRPPRTYSFHENPRFPPPNLRPHQRPPFNSHSTHSIDHHDKNNYRESNNQRMPDHRGGHHSRPPLFPFLFQHTQNIRQKNSNQGNSYSNPFKYFNNVQQEPNSINNMGDFDHQQTAHLPHSRDSFGHRTSTWAHPPNDNRKHCDERSPHKSYRFDSADPVRVPGLDYAGHRPPSSDHYGGTSGPTLSSNNTSFSRSVDDTVDIIRKRLMNRNEQQNSQDTVIDQSNSEQEVQEHIHHQIPQEQPAKKKLPRLRQNVKSNCDKMKTNIVHQLFKMDKDKMHKLMDDPGSSSKFEFAISSLITESQISLNRQLRSVAEKSLYSSSTDFIHNDNNTIYEDTFMKQMQCLLDPQDSVLLEDIKPIVMAELSKVLQLDDDFEPRYDMPHDQVAHPRDDQPYFETYNYDEYAHEAMYVQDQSTSSNHEDSNNTPQIDANTESIVNYNYDEGETTYEDSKPLFKRRPIKQTDHSEEKRQSIENRRQRSSLDNSNEDIFRGKEEPLALFESNAEPVSEEDDPFAELDRQYHVAVDPNFIGSYDVSARATPISNLPPDCDNEMLNIRNEMMLHEIPKSNLPMSNSAENPMRIKQEVTQDFPKENSTPLYSGNCLQQMENVKIEQDHAPRSKDINKETDKSNSTNIIKNNPSNSRKRSIDQRPSHRKEKRKKSDSSYYESSKHSRSSARHSDKCNDAPKTYYSIFSSKDNRHKETSRYDKKIDSSERRYSDKYVKRKESSNRPKERKSESQRKRHSSSSSQTILSPKDNINSSNQTLTKVDPKLKLKTIDMFVEQPKKVSVHHQAHRNTASSVTPTKPYTEENKTKQIASTPTKLNTEEIKIKQIVTSTNNKTVQTQKQVETQVTKKLVTKETQTFESKIFTTRYSQTEKKKCVAKFAQTDPFSFESIDISKPKSTDAFERMKEIDMEIQVLLQEKFKLYSSLESKHSCPSSMPSLGMTVLNVAPVDENKEIDNNELMEVNNLNEETITEEYTIIPVEELEQIALETIAEEDNETTFEIKRNLRQKMLHKDRKNSESPTSSKLTNKRNTKKNNEPNISLIEQIITDDRPLEDIISLEHLEETPTKGKKKPQKGRPKKKNTKKSKPSTSITVNDDICVFDIKPCSVVLVRADLSKFVKESDNNLTTWEIIEPLSDEDENSVEVVPSVISKTIKQKENDNENVDNDIQFDMLDVSEDIVIGDCEIKSNEDKEEREVVTEDVILDNSQSSADDLIATDGSQVENECRMYDYSTDEKLRRDSLVVTGHADAVLAIECIGTNFIAACLDGNVYHFSGEGQLLCTMRGSNLAVTCLTIVKEKYGTTVYTGSLDSRIRYYDLDTGLEKGPECNVLSPIQTMDRAWDTVFVGTRTGFVLQFECKNNMLIPVSTVKFSDQSILALRAMKEGPRKVLLVAARSEEVTIKDAQTGLLLRTLSGPKMTVYTLLLEDGKVFCGTSSHQIHVYDYASGMHTGFHEGGKGAVCLRATGGLLFAGCYDGCVYVYREGDPRPLAQLRGPSLMLLSLAIVGSKIIAGYKDRSLYIWKIPLCILQEMIL